MHAVDVQLGVLFPYYQEFIIKEEYPTLTIPCTNALRKVTSVNHHANSLVLY